MAYSKPPLSLNDRLLEVYQLAAEEYFPGVVVQERSRELRIKSLIRLPVGEDLPQFTGQQHFRIPEESLATITLNDYVMFSCDIPVHASLDKRNVPFAEELTKVDKSTALQIKDEIHRKLKEHAKSERLSEHRRSPEPGREDRAAGLRQLPPAAARVPQGTQSEDRRQSRRATEAGALLQAGQGTQRPHQQG